MRRGGRFLDNADLFVDVAWRLRSSWFPDDESVLRHQQTWLDGGAIGDTIPDVKTPALRLVDAVPWVSGLAGEYPGQRSYIELGTGGVRLVFCWCPPTLSGQGFMLGSPSDEPDRSSDEKLRQVTFADGFWLAQHPVNQQQWRAVMGENPSQRGRGDLYPVDSVSWNDAQKFCREKGLRLPTEVEWEYACRAGTTTPFGIGGGGYLNAQMANFDGNYPYGTGREAFKWLHREHTVTQASFPPNAWGLHDMHGQLWEWCEDTYAGRDRVLRGGSWFHIGWAARSASRCSIDPDYRGDYFGFRPCPSSTTNPARMFHGVVTTAEPETPRRRPMRAR